VQPAWRLVKENGTDFTCEMDAARGDVGVLQYFNLLDKDWQAYIFAREREVFEAFDFDGWHGDTIGENGRMTNANGGPLGFSAHGEPIYTVKECYTAFLNAAKRAIAPKFLDFNPVGAQGIEQVNQSDVDVLYTEFWPWDSDTDGQPYDSYLSLHRAIVRAAAQSGGKSLVVAAYVNYRNAAAAFNTPAVRLLDSVVFASGGARIELGNGDGMLSDEYFPADRHKRMDESLQTAVTRLYDFAVAYENLLRDGQTPVTRTVEIEGVAVSADGAADAVWVFAKADAQQEIYHLINLCGTDTDWRDVAQTKAAPTPLNGLRVKLYTGFTVGKVLLASPDGPDLSAAEVPFTRGADARGVYIALTVPSLAYWNMIVLR
jgi:dextranase